MNIELMLDLETLSLEDNAAIVQIACSNFNGADNFNERIAPSTYGKLLGKFSRTQGTLDWWDQQPEEIRSYVFGGVLHPVTVLEMFTNYIKTFPEPPIIWANPAVFDFTILESAYHAFDMEFPIDWRNTRCFRTLSQEFNSIVPRDKSKTTHNAVQDCADQIEHIKLIRQHYGKP